MAADPATAAVTLSDAEVYYLTHMREEERLSRDVYTTLNETYGATVSSKIIPSEPRHFDAVGTLIDHYGVTDPAPDATVGLFTIDEFIELYPNRRSCRRLRAGRQRQCSPWRTWRRA